MFDLGDVEPWLSILVLLLINVVLYLHVVLLLKINVYCCRQKC